MPFAGLAEHIQMRRNSAYNCHGITLSGTDYYTASGIAISVGNQLELEKRLYPIDENKLDSAIATLPAIDLFLL
uniref:Uncharacterized protein n=1 Tax=Rhizophora mucronata TaxID=61149 RepID=A0A2P2K4I0_RHIMU